MHVRYRLRDIRDRRESPQCWPTYAGARSVFGFMGFALRPYESGIERLLSGCGTFFCARPRRISAALLVEPTRLRLSVWLCLPIRLISVPRSELRLCARAIKRRLCRAIVFFRFAESI